MQDGTAAPSHGIAQPVRDEDRPASRHQKIGLRGQRLAFAAAAAFVVLAVANAGFHREIRPEVWAWGRTSLTGVFLAGLVLIAYGFGIHASNIGSAAAVAAVQESRADMHDDHAALHQDYIKLREMLGVLTESAARRKAFEERRTLELKALRQEVEALREHVKTVYELLAAQVHESPPARVIHLQPPLPQAKKPRQRGRGNRQDRRSNAEPQEPASAPESGALWSPGDDRWQQDVAEAAKLGRQLGPGPEPA